MSWQQLPDDELHKICGAARSLTARLAEHARVQERITAEIRSMGVRDSDGSIRKFLYRSECGAAQREAHALAIKIDSLLRTQTNTE
ncbi:ETS [Samia ricini nucleopolyhedrovirus]|nr:ETS [Samia ricini nucleopolyhedrovirus]BBD51321.1 ETS [Samia ricini nucleopolyhedrovirus]BBD51473.1 ETS [Samia ricini nucleopolyhedrovirus]